MWRLYRAPHTSKLLIALENVSHEKVSDSAAWFGLELMESPTSSFVGPVPLRPIRCLVGSSSVRPQLGIMVHLGSDSPFGVVARCPEVPTSDSLDEGECLS